MYASISSYLSVTAFFFFNRPELPGENCSERYFSRLGLSGRKVYSRPAWKHFFIATHFATATNYHWDSIWEINVEKKQRKRLYTFTFFSKKTSFGKNQKGNYFLTLNKPLSKDWFFLTTTESHLWCCKAKIVSRKSQ